MAYLDEPEINCGCLLGGAFVLFIAVPALLGMGLAGPCIEDGPCPDKRPVMLAILVGAPIVALIIAWLTNLLIRRWRDRRDR